MKKLLKYIAISFVFFLSSSISCLERKEETDIYKTECEKIKDIVTDCLDLHRGAFDYVSSCGDISLSEISKLMTCKEKIDYIENK